jgi:lipopolysaccharide export system permease protein
MFILVMQFFWKYIDDLMGKGLSVDVIIELLFYVSASLIPLALPLAILLSSIMTLGNLAENNELTALKSSGLSLYRIIRPLASIVVVIALFTFYFSNYVIPVANLKWHSLIFDIQNTKISSIITPGVYSKELDGYAIKVEEGTEDEFKGILIHDLTSPDEVKTIRAEEGKIYKSENGKDLYFELKNGYVVEELQPQPPSFTPNGESHLDNSRPSRRSTFEQATYKIDLAGFDLDRSREELFKDKHEMMNVFQLNMVMDSINLKAKTILESFVRNLKNDHAYYLALQFVENTPEAHLEKVEASAAEGVVVFKDLTRKERISTINNAQSKLRNKNRNLQSQLEFLGGMENDMDSFMIEFNRKFALTVAIIILFLVGAPLGAIVKRGGFGAPVVIAALLFMVYFVLITIGESLAKSGTVSPFAGMWFASFVLAPIALYLLRSAANDSPIFGKEAIRRFNFIKRLK